MVRGWRGGKWGEEWEGGFEGVSSGKRCEGVGISTYINSFYTSFVLTFYERIPTVS